MGFNGMLVGFSWDFNGMIIHIVESSLLVMSVTVCELENGPVEILCVFPLKDGDFP